MKRTQKIATLAVAVLLIATAYGLFRTRGQPNNSPTSLSSANGGTQAGPVVDQSTLWTARWLAQMPTTAEERQTAEDALHIADKEMDLAFATAVREAEQHPIAMSEQFTPERVGPALKVATVWRHRCSCGNDRVWVGNYPGC